ncbi:MAG: hypothetical protein HWD60_00925 [Defluviicoccus sp.]|nr:MAG: hypothetical protein HWD60_00925 [Defluviicoccus sp.]
MLLQLPVYPAPCGEEPIDLGKHVRSRVAAELDRLVDRERIAAQNVVEVPGESRERQNRQDGKQIDADLIGTWSRIRIEERLCIDDPDDRPGFSLDYRTVDGIEVRRVQREIIDDAPDQHSAVEVDDALEIARVELTGRLKCAGRSGYARHGEFRFITTVMPEDAPALNSPIRATFPPAVIDRKG